MIHTNNMGSVLAENAFNTMFLLKTPHIVELYIMPKVWRGYEDNCLH